MSVNCSSVSIFIPPDYAPAELELDDDDEDEEDEDEDEEDEDEDDIDDALAEDEEDEDRLEDEDEEEKEELLTSCKINCASCLPFHSKPIICIGRVSFMILAPTVVPDALTRSGVHVNSVPFCHHVIILAASAALMLLMGIFSRCFAPSSY
jgi:hypothetical protein